MSVAVDANVLLHASDSASALHRRAVATLRNAAEGPDLLYVFWPVAMAYLRVATHPSVFERPLSPAEATANVEALVSRPNVRTPGEDSGFWATFRAVTDQVVVRGNLISDAHVVALMRQYGVRAILSRDRDFAKFDGVEAVDPFA